MSKELPYPKIILMVSLLLAMLFTYTATAKLMHIGIFEMRLERMPYIAPYAQWISWSVPFLELVIAALLFFKKYCVTGLYASLILLGLFTGYIITVLQFSDSVPCSCGGIVSALGWRDHIIFNGTFMMLALVGIIWSKKHEKRSLNKNTT